jgi:tRNA(Ile)-lysidine synthase
MGMELHKRVLSLIHSHKLIPSGVKVVVGVSGGADSLALLHILNRIKGDIICELHVATLDHGLRGDAGAADAQFVVDTAQSWGLTVTMERIDVPVLARTSSLGIEAVARRARYEFLARVAHQQDASIIVVAHNADDQAETVLMHILRGSGSDGLGGMHPSMPLLFDPELTLIRPLLSIKRAEIDTYCTESELNPRQDVTNKDTSYLRNRIRHEILPALKEINPQFDRGLVQLAEIMRAESDTLGRLFHEHIDEAVSVTPNRVSLVLSLFLGLDIALKRRFIRWAGEQIQGVVKTSEISFQHIEAALEIIEQGETGKRASLPGRLQVRRGYSRLYVEMINAPIESEAPLLAEGEIVEIAVPGVTPFGEGWELVVDEVRNYQEGVYLFIPIGGQVHLRGRQVGEEFSPNQIQQSLKNWMINNKVPSELRSRVPLIIVNDTIASVIWGMLWRRASRGAGDKGTQHGFHFSVRRNKSI